MLLVFCLLPDFAAAVSGFTEISSVNIVFVKSEVIELLASECFVVVLAASLSSFAVLSVKLLLSLVRLLVLLSDVLPSS
jgi:hypothetical protein